MKIYHWLIISCFLLKMPTIIWAQDATDIIQKSEEIRRGIESSEAEMTMTIVRPTWTRDMSLKAWSKGEDYALILVTAPARDKGNANLKRYKEIWSWVPRIERTVKLPPSMMSQSWMGSDFTNEDLVRENSIITDYHNRLLGDTIVLGRATYKIELIPKEEAAVIWGKVIMYIDKADYLQLRSEFYDEDLYLINIMQATEVGELGNRPFVIKMEMVPVEEEGKKTIMTYHDISFDENIPEAFFSIQNMKRIR